MIELSEFNNLDDNPLAKKIKELDGKLDKFSSILEKFGLDIITKMGQTNLKITQLTDKVNDLHKATIDVKGLSPQLSNIVENQKNLEKEVELLKSLITSLKFSAPKNQNIEESIERDKSATYKKDSIITTLKSVQSKLETNANPKECISILQKIKEDIFEFTGGHRILYEISQTINRLNTIETMSDLFSKNDPNSDTMREYLTEKITFWINKLK